MKHSTLPLALGAALLFVGYLGGTIVASSGSADAIAAPACNGAKDTYVTGDAASLTIWRISDDKVIEAHTYSAKDGQLHESAFQPGMPAPAANPPAGSGQGKSCGSCGGDSSCG